MEVQLTQPAATRAHKPGRRGDDACGHRKADVVDVLSATTSHSELRTGPVLPLPGLTKPRERGREREADREFIDNLIRRFGGKVLITEVRS
jgi:hypothetical protein